MSFQNNFQSQTEEIVHVHPFLYLNLTQTPTIVSGPTTRVVHMYMNTRIYVYDTVTYVYQPAFQSKTTVSCAKVINILCVPNVHTCTWLLARIGVMEPIDYFFVCAMNKFEHERHIIINTRKWVIRKYPKVCLYVFIQRNLFILYKVSVRMSEFLWI